MSVDLFFTKTFQTHQCHTNEAVSHIFITLSFFTPDTDLISVKVLVVNIRINLLDYYLTASIRVSPLSVCLCVRVSFCLSVCEGTITQK